ncbi:E3 ubiquitin-protein ligase rnf168 isoform X1, partial [Silurus meridionalis]
MPPVSEEDLELGQDGKLKRVDCLCPICLEIFLEPVTLPCTHTFCKPCFLETVDKANICCPLCRKRVSTWARLNGRNKTLVNAELWRRIQDAFPTQCQRRLNGVDEEEDMNVFIQKPRVSQPGELRREYEEEINKFVEEKRALEEAERRASEEYIQRLLAEEEDRLEEEKRKQEERQLENDERLARLLSEELNSSPVLETQRNSKVNDATKKKKSNMGHIEKYLCQVPYTPPHGETKQSSSLLDNKENILNTPSSTDTSIVEMEISNFSSKPSTSSSDSDFSTQLFETPCRTSICSKRKSGHSEQAEPDSCKKPCNSPLPVSPPCGSIFLQELAEQEEVLRSRMLQEEEDRRLALRLQKELNQENAVDRRKGSADGYLLREKSSPSSNSSTSPGEESKTEKDTIPHSSRQNVDGHKSGKKASSQVESKTFRKNSKQVSSSASSAQNGRRQTTITQMFSNLGS